MADDLGKDGHERQPEPRLRRIAAERDAADQRRAHQRQGCRPINGKDVGKQRECWARIARGVRTQLTSNQQIARRGQRAEQRQQVAGDLVRAFPRVRQSDDERTGERDRHADHHLARHALLQEEVRDRADE